MVRWQDSNNYYYLAFQGDGRLRLREYVGGNSNTFATVDPDLSRDTWYTLTLEVSGDTTPTLRAYVNGTPVLTATDSTPASNFTSGPCALGSYEGSAQFDDVVVTEGGTSTVLLSDNFEDGEADGWTVQAGDWAVTPSNYVYDQSNYGSTTRTFIGSPAWTDYSIQSRVRLTHVGSGSTYAMLMARYQDKDNYYFMAVRANQTIEIKRMFGGSSGDKLVSTPYSVTTGTWYTATLEVKGYTLRAYMNGTPVLTVTDSTSAFAAGYAALGSSKVMAQFDDVVITDLSMYTLTVDSIGTGTGSVTSDPAGIDCGLTCTADFEAGTVVTLTATPTGTHTFAGWLGACSGTGDCVVTIDEAKSVTAVFSSASDPMLVVNKTGSGDGSVTSNPEGIDCGITCTVDFPATTVVTLTATADNLSTFMGWSGDCIGTGSTCTVTMDAAKNVTAQFQMTAVSVTKTGNGGGSITSKPPGVYCGVTCTVKFNYGTVVTLTAAHDTDSVFGGWSGSGCSGSGDCVVTVDDFREVEAAFNLITHTLTVNRAGNGMGSTLSVPAGISNCSTAVCTATFDINTVVTLTASPNTTSYFAGWDGEGCSGTGSCAVTMTADRGVTATFSTHVLYLPLIMKGDGAAPAGPDFSMVGYATESGGTTVHRADTVSSIEVCNSLNCHRRSTRSSNAYVSRSSALCSSETSGLASTLA